MENSVDPLRDIEILNSELILSDLEMLDRQKKKKVPKVLSVFPPSTLKLCLQGNSAAVIRMIEKCMKSAPSLRLLLGYGSDVLQLWMRVGQLARVSVFIDRVTFLSAPHPL